MNRDDFCYRSPIISYTKTSVTTDNPPWSPSLPHHLPWCFRLVRPDLYLFWRNDTISTVLNLLWDECHEKTWGRRSYEHDKLILIRIVAQMYLYVSSALFVGNQHFPAFLISAIMSFVVNTTVLEHIILWEHPEHVIHFVTMRPRDDWCISIGFNTINGE